MHTLAIWVLIVVAACGSREHVKQTSTGPGCAEAIDALMKPYAKTSTKEEAKLFSNVRAVLVTRCNEDRWSDAARTCTAHASSKDGLRDCWRTTLTVEQHERAARAFADTKRGGIDEWFAAMERLKAQMCACQDYACTQRVEADIDKVTESVRGEPNESDTERAGVLVEAIHKCKRENPEDVRRRQEGMAAMRRFKDHMCVCRDATCAQQVSDEMTAWSKAESARDGESPGMTEEDQKEAAQIGEAMGECMQRAMSAVDPALASRVLAEMKQFKTRMCACKNATCAGKISAEIKEWAPTTQHVRRAMNEADHKTSDAIHEALEKCRRRLQP